MKYLDGDFATALAVNARVDGTELAGAEDLVAEDLNWTLNCISWTLANLVKLTELQRRLRIGGIRLQRRRLKCLLKGLEPSLPTRDAIRTALPRQLCWRRSSRQGIEVLADAVRDIRRGSDLETVRRSASKP